MSETRRAKPVARPATRPSSTARSASDSIRDRLTRRDRSPLVIMLAVLLVSTLVALAVVGWRWRADVARFDAGAAATEVAEDRAAQILTWDSATLDEDFGWTDDGATESFARAYEDSVAALRDAFTGLQVRSTGTVVASSAQTESAERVVVSLFVAQSVLQGTGAAEVCQFSKVELTMVRADDRWLVDDLAAPGESTTVPC